MSAPQRFTPSPPAEDPDNANRFTLTDYVYDREEDADLPRPPLVSASTSNRPSSWGMALQGELSNVRGSTILSTKGKEVEVEEIISPSRGHGTRMEGQMMGRPSLPAIPPSNTSTTISNSFSASNLDNRIYPNTSASSSTMRKLPSLPVIDSNLVSPPSSSYLRPLPDIPSSNTMISSSSSMTSPSASNSASTIQPILQLPTTPPNIHRGSSFNNPPAFEVDRTQSGSITSPLSASNQQPQPLPLLLDRPALQAYGSTSDVGESSNNRLDTELEILPSISRSFRPNRISGVSGLTGCSQDDKELELGEKKDYATGKNVSFQSELPKGKSNANWVKKWFIPDSFLCKLLLGIVILELIVDLTIEANILSRFNAEVNSNTSTAAIIENKRRLPIFLIIFGLAHLWQLILTVIAIQTKSSIQITAITIFNFAFLAWAVIQVKELRDILGNLQTSLEGNKENLLNLPLNVLTAVIIGVVSVGSLGLVILTWLIRKEFGWEKYRFLGADLQIRDYYRKYQIFECVCYFSAFFCLGFGIQFIWLVLEPTDVEYIITWVFLPVSLILLIIGRTAAKYENKPFMYFFGFGLVLGQAYFIFKLVKIWSKNSTIYENVSKSLTVFDVLSLISLICCSVGSVLVMRNFGKGLKEAVLAQPRNQFKTMLGFNKWRSGHSGMTEKESKRISID